MPLPFFLRPLLLISYYQEHLARYVAGWLFGPLEQLVTAVVIVGLAMQGPPQFWDPSQLMQPIVINGAKIPHHSVSMSNEGTKQDLNHARISTGSTLLDAAYSHIPIWLHFSPITSSLILLTFDLALVFIPRKVKIRIKDSWGLFWPPWQDRTFAGHSGQPSKRSESERARAAKIADSDKIVSHSNTAEEPKDGSHKKPQKSPKMALSDTSGDGAEKKKATESETSRKVKDGDSGGTKPADSTNKGKGRMEGERPNASKSSSRSMNDASSNSPSTGSPTTQTVMRDTAVTPGTTKDADDNQITPKSGSSLGTTVTDTDDPLMAGDYRPLKSVLKKSKRKPKQAKNIHHNYFMTMRGYRPSLIPFPHGFHPKPHEPRNTLWWDNVPKNAEHIMAPPPVAKQPEKGEDDGDGKKRDDKAEGKEVKPEKQEEAARERNETKDDGHLTDSNKDIQKDADKHAKEADAKAKAKREAELKSFNAKEMDPSSASPSTSSAKLSQVLVDPRVQKATYMSQGLLCVLLYHMHQQLGFLLLTVFAWQYINAHDHAVSADQVATSMSSSKQSEPNTSRSGLRSKSTAEMDPSMEGKLDDARKARREKALTETSQSTVRSMQEPKRSQKIEELDKTIEGLKSAADPTSELRDKLGSAERERQSLAVGFSQAQCPTQKETTDQKNKMKEGMGDLEVLEQKAKEMDDYVQKARGVSDPSNEQKNKLAKAEEGRKQLWKRLRAMRSANGTGKHPAESSKTAQDKRDQTIRKCEELKNRIQEMEGHMERYRKVDRLSHEQEEKLLRVQGKRSDLKEELMVYEDRLNVISSGLSIEDKDALVI
ncbi:uncharacterized protein IL334_002396 [Kwoniella shivajii]|uniref:Uncharacterized protein n=1 Tax=Kwoniella shivajii TaxID=564305 RepID=A0ABZ1CUM0_9TREE|nr:hypothetical protein IL334_002396 [Kwoniella shivajii]